MTLVTVKKIQLQKDSTSTRSKFLMDKIKPLHSPTKIWTNPSWALPTDEEVVEVSGIEYDEEEIIKLLDKAGTDLETAATETAKMKIETELAIALHEFMKDLPQKVLFDNAFWFYLFWKSPIYGVHRYDTWDATENLIKSETRMYGGWTRASIPATYLAYYLANECGITETDYRVPGKSRVRLWILDESPLISKQLRKSFVSAVIGGKHLDNTWSALFQKLGALDVDALTQEQVDTLIAGL